MKLLLDMNLSRDWVSFFNQHDIHAVHWSEVGDPRAPDDRIIAFAAANQLVILTRDLHFGEALIRGNLPSPTVLQIRADQASPHLIGAQIIEALRSRSKEIVAGALLTIHLQRTRLRLLPSRQDVE